MAATTGAFSNLLAPGLFDVMFNEIDSFPSQWMSVLNVYDTERNYEEELKVAGLGSMVAKPEGTATSYDDPLISNKVTYTPASYGLGFRVTREMYDDDLYDIMNGMSAELGRAAAYKVEVDAWSTLNYAFTAGYTGIDGLVLCSTAHTRLDGGANIANKPSSDVDFSFTALQAAIEHFKTLKDDRGRPVQLTPALVVLDPTFEWAGKEILQSEFRPYTANNEVNALRGELSSNGYLSCRYLTDADSWFVLAQKKQQRRGQGHDLKFFWRTRPETANGDDFDTGDAKFKIFARYAKGFGEWRGVYGSSGGS